MVLRSPFSDVSIPKVDIAQHALEKLKTFGDSVAMIDPQLDQTWTFNQLYEESVKFALKLRSIGVQKGDVVGLVVDFHPKYFPFVLGIMLCKATLAAGNINAVPKDIAKQLKLVKAKYAICDKPHESKHEIAAEIDSVKILDVEGIENIVFSSEEDQLEEIVPSSDEDDDQHTLIITFTSGSTGEPKAIESTNVNLLSVIGAVIVPLNLQHGDCVITLCHQLHMFGFWSFFMYLVIGVKHIVTTSLSPKLFSKCVKMHGANGALISDFVTFSRITNEATLDVEHTLRFIVVGGATTPMELIENARKKFNVIVTSAYGSSEVGFVSCCATKKLSSKSSGVLCPNVQLKVIDIENGDELSPGQQGELYVKSPCVFKGYLNNKEATKQVLDESGWFKTGDLGYYDENGVIYVIDRLKSMIKSHGNMAVFPSQLEAVLLSHPSVAEAVVVRTTHPVYNEAAKAFVVKKDKSLTTEELLKFYNSQVAEYQQLFGGLEFIDHIPKTGLGKPNKLAL